MGSVHYNCFARLEDPSKKEMQDLQTKLSKADEELTAHRKHVTEHFMTTATLVNNMTDSYRALYEHMATGAKSLCDKEIVNYHLDLPETRLLDEINTPEEAEAIPQVDDIVKQDMTEESEEEATAVYKKEEMDKSEAESVPVEIEEKAEPLPAEAAPSVALDDQMAETTMAEDIPLTEIDTPPHGSRSVH